VSRVRDEFRVHRLNETGLDVAAQLGEIFTEALDKIEAIVGPEGREMALVRTNLQHASFFAKRAMAQQSRFQQ
jgi:hypothetical protein